MDFEIVGALAKSKSNATIFFCEYNHTNLEKNIIQSLINKTQYKDDVYGDRIKLLAIESEDELKQDIRLVGLIFEDEVHSQHKSILLEQYQDLSVYLEEMVSEGDEE